MAYTPTNWQDGDLITAEKLNKLEQGAANDVDSQTVRNIETVDKATFDELVKNGAPLYTVIIDANGAAHAIAADISSESYVPDEEFAAWLNGIFGAQP